MRGVRLEMEESWMGDVMQNGGYTRMQTIVVIDLSASVVPGIVLRHQNSMPQNIIRKVFCYVFAMGGIYFWWFLLILSDFRGGADIKKNITIIMHK